jgi:NAD(P)-dependent dehydrogenase (short-subunit alcohol dehydrogenase family)
MNPVALITGASRGIGRGIALELARLGHDLVLNYARNERAARETAEDCLVQADAEGRRIQVELCQADIGRAADRERLVGFARQRFDQLDLLVNNAGVAPTVRADLLVANESSFDRLIDVNLKGPFFLTQLVARRMIEVLQWLKESGVEAPPPKIVFISSISAYTASVYRGDYCLSKAGVSMLTALFATRLAEHGIHVYEVRPGIIETDMTAPVRETYDGLIQQGLTPIRRWGTPADVGKAVAAIAQNLLPFSTGEVLNVDGGFHLRRL